MNLAGYKAFLYPSYWFNLRSFPMPHSWIVGLSIFFGLYVFAGIVFGVLGRRGDPLIAKRLRGLSRLFWIVGLLGYLWLIFSYEQAAVLGARFWFLVFGLMTIVKVILTLVDIKKNLRRERAERSERERFQKYLPKKNK